MTLQEKVSAVIISCKTPAQLRVAVTFAHRALAVLGQTYGEAFFQSCYANFARLVQAKSQQMKLRRRIAF